MADDKIWKKLAPRVIAAGKIPFGASETFIEILKLLLTEEEAEFLLFFKKPSLNMEQLKDISNLDHALLEQKLGVLMRKGIIMSSTSRSTGTVVYTVQPPFPGLFEYTLMKGEKGEREHQLARLFERMFSEISTSTQRIYDDIVPRMRDYPGISRVVPIEAEVEVPDEVVLVTEQATKVIDGSDTIALTHCYCRHERDLMANPCKRTSKRENCLVLGKSGEFAVKEGFARPISKEEAKQILRDAEKDGLVHMVFHSKMDVGKEVEGVCSCCPCCCGIFRLFYNGSLAFHTSTSYVARVNKDACVACESCVEACPMQAIKMDDEIPVIEYNRCIGCGACVNACQSDAMHLDRTGPRDVFIPPPRLQQA